MGYYLEKYIIKEKILSFNNSWESSWTFSALEK